MSEDTTGQWLDCLVDSDYEIYDQYPYPIRKKGSDRIIKESLNNNGYVQCMLNQRNYKKHRIVAIQFIPNPNELPQVDHINHNKSDNRIENLRWVSSSENNFNRSSRNRIQYTFLNELPETAESLDSYNGHDFDGLYINYDTEKLYLFNGVNYRELVPHRYRGNISYQVCDIENKLRSLAHKVLFG